MAVDVGINAAKMSSVSLADSMIITSRIRQICKQKKECETRAQTEQIAKLRIKFSDQAKQLGVVEEAAIDALSENTALAEIGEYNLILQVLKEFQDVLNAKCVLAGRRPQSTLEFALWKSVEF